MNGLRTVNTAVRPHWAIAAVLLVLVAAPARAAEDAPVPGATIGTGTFSCAKFGKYDSARNNSEQMDLIVQWAWGFMSSYNNRAAFSPTFQEADAPNPVSPPDAKGILAFIRKHCAQSADSNVANAILELISSKGGIVTSSIALPQS
jgi:hypothetical protein